MKKSTVKKYGLISVGIIILILIGSLIHAPKTDTESMLQIGHEAVQYIKDYQLSPSATIELLSIKELEWVYEFKISIDGNNFTSYVTKDGGLIFPNAINTSYQIETNQPIQDELPKPNKTESPIIKLFVMSFCPYGNMAEENIKEVIDLLGDKISIDLHYIIYEGYPEEYCLDQEAEYCSMHGINELNQGVRELCVKKYYPDTLWDFILNVNDNCTNNDVEECWGPIADELSIDESVISECQAEEAIAMLDVEKALSNEYGVTGSPHIIVNDVAVVGVKSSNDYKKLICSAFINQPIECEEQLSTTLTPSGSC